MSRVLAKLLDKWISFCTFCKFLAIKKYPIVTSAKILPHLYAQKSLNSKPQSNLSLLSFSWGAPTSNVTSLQAHVHVRSLGHYLRLSYFAAYDKSIRQELTANYRNRNSIKSITLDQPFYCLPYYNTQFGHYTGELFGTILYYLEFISTYSERKLILIRTGGELDKILERVGHNKIRFFDPELILDNPVINLTDSIVLECMHPWQNLRWLSSILISHNFYQDIKSSQVSKKEKIFLTSKRSERIINIDEVEKYLISNGFHILTPKNLQISDIYYIQNSSIFITEDASLSHLALMHRSKTYYCFTPKIAEPYSASISDGGYAGGFVFNEYHKFLRIPIYCDVVHAPESHTMSVQLHVDLDHLSRII